MGEIIIVFSFFFSFLIFQRLLELVIASKNEKWLKNKGGYEVGRGHYVLMVLLHTFFLISLLIEVTTLNRELSLIWPTLLLFFLVTQIIRIWALLSLGKYWNTKIIVLPNTSIIKKGPYKFLRHPNYVIVIAEILLIPLLFQAYLTAGIFSLLNLWMLSIRIPMEEKALIAETDYQEKFETVSRFAPFRMKKVQD